MEWDGCAIKGGKEPEIKILRMDDHILFWECAQEYNIKGQIL